jgi:transketolase
MIVTVEDHFPAGGLGEAVLAALAERPAPVTIMAVRKIPMSGTPDEQRQFAGISAAAIAETCERLVHGHARKAAPALRE